MGHNGILIISLNQCIIELKPNIEVTYRNNDDIDRLIERLDFVFIDNTANKLNVPP